MSDVPAKKRKTISLQEKRDILNDYLSGKFDMAELARKYNHKYTSIMNICKRDKGKISIVNDEDLDHNLSTKIRPEIMIKMEAMLFTWIENCNQKGFPLVLKNIAKKSMQIYNSLKAAHDPENKHSFNASRGWFDKFKKRYNLHNLVFDGKWQADSFVDTFSEEINGIYTLDQVFKLDETGQLSWKRKPKSTFEARPTESTPENKDSKEELTLLMDTTEETEQKVETSNEPPRKRKTKKPSTAKSNKSNSRRKAPTEAVLIKTEEVTEQRIEMNRKGLHEIINTIEKLKSVIREKDPDYERVFLVENELNKIEKFYLDQLKMQQKAQTTIDPFFKTEYLEC